MVAMVQPSANNDFLRVIEEKSGDGVRLIARIEGLLDVTATVEATVTEASTTRNLRETVDSAGKQRFVLLGLSRKNKRLSWSYRYRVFCRPGGRGGRHDDSQVYLLPYPPAARYRVVQGPLGRISHGEGSQNECAIDWAMSIGTRICAARGGIVVGVRQDSDRSDDPRESASNGNYLVLRHADGTYGEYLHLQKRGALVTLGQAVRAGEPIALSGNTGYSTGPHLHFAVFRNLDGLRRQTIPVRFRTASGTPRELREGEFP